MTKRGRSRSPVLLTCVLIAATGGLGCSFYYSSKSLSDSSQSSSKSLSGSSRSSSDSSSPARAEARRYEQDVADYTEAYVVSGGGDGAFLRGVGELAAKSGVSDWESDDNTWEGIGRGLARVEVSDVQLEVYKSNWTGGNADKMKRIQSGYDAER